MSDGRRPGSDASRGWSARARRRVAVATAAGVALCLLPNAFAVALSPEGPNKPDAAKAVFGAPHERLVDYVVKDQSLAETLNILSMITGIPIAITGKVEGRVRAMRLTGKLGAVIERLSSQYGFFYASDGVRFTVQARETSVVTIVDVAKVKHPAALQLLASLFPALSDGSVESRPDLGVVVLRGPADFVDTAKSVLARDPDAVPDKLFVFRFGLLKVEHPE